MPTLDEIVRRGYLPKELPTPFGSETLADAVATHGLGAFAGGLWMKPVTHNLARPGRMYRRLSTPHPLHFVQLADVVASSWSDISSHMGRSTLSLSTAVADTTSHRAIVPKNALTIRATRRARDAAGARYVIRADVSQFYPSVYTHALEWAFTSKAAAKAALKAKATPGPGANVDKIVSRGQDGQTVGIPIGPDTSFALGELLMSRVDQTMRESLPTRRRSAFIGTRYYDDYELYAKDRSDAATVASHLQRALAEWELTINPYKFRIDPLPVELEESWVSTLKRIDVPADDGSAERAGIEALFSEAFRLRPTNEDENVLAYAIGRFIATNFSERHVVARSNSADVRGPSASGC